jgi:uncharacterized protein (TIGR04255 family)
MSPAAERKKLRNQPVKLVLCQVRWSPIQTIATYIPAIQEVFRRHGFPIERSGETPQVFLSPKGVEVKTQPRWEYKSKDERWSILVMPDSVVLQTTDYDRFEGYAEKLRLAVDTVFQATEHDKFGVLERIGLRYIDHIRPQAGEDYRAYVKAGLHGIQDDGVFLPDTKRLHCETVGATKVGSERGTLIIRLTQNNEGMELPPDLLGAAPPWSPSVKPGEWLTIIDTDHFLEGKFECDAGWIVRQADLLHDQINEAFFNHVITEHALEVWA